MSEESALSVSQQSNEGGKEHKPWQFKPGQSGNPKGRKPGNKNLTTMLKDALKEIAIHPKTGEKILLNGNEATWGQLLVAQSLFKGVLKGEKTIHAMIYDRVEGKARTTIDFNDLTDKKEEEFDSIKKMLSILTHGREGQDTSESQEETPSS